MTCSKVPNNMLKANKLYLIWTMCVNVWAHAAESKGPEFGHVRDQFGFIRAMEGHADFFFPNGDLLKIQNSEILKVHITPMYHFFFWKWWKPPIYHVLTNMPCCILKRFRAVWANNRSVPSTLWFRPHVLNHMPPS